jgi:hypothetical protein
MEKTNPMENIYAFGPNEALEIDSNDAVPFRAVGSPADAISSLKQKSEKLATMMINNGPNKALPAFWNAKGRDNDPPPTMVDKILKRADDIVPSRSSIVADSKGGNNAPSASLSDGKASAESGSCSSASPSGTILSGSSGFLPLYLFAGPLSK